MGIRKRYKYSIIASWDIDKWRKRSKEIRRGAVLYGAGNFGFERSDGKITVYWDFSDPENMKKFARDFCVVDCSVKLYDNLDVCGLR